MSLKVSHSSSVVVVLAIIGTCLTVSGAFFYLASGFFEHEVVRQDVAAAGVFEFSAGGVSVPLRLPSPRVEGVLLVGRVELLNGSSVSYSVVGAGRCYVSGRVEGVEKFVAVIDGGGGELWLNLSVEPGGVVAVQSRGGVAVKVYVEVWWEETVKDVFPLLLFAAGVLLLALSAIFRFWSSLGRCMLLFCGF